MPHLIFVKTPALKHSWEKDVKIGPIDLKRAVLLPKGSFSFCTRPRPNLPAIVKKQKLATKSLQASLSILAWTCNEISEAFGSLHQLHQLHHGSYWKGAPVFSPERKRLLTTSMRSLVSQHGLGDLWRKSLDPFTKWMKKHFSTYRERYRYYIYIYTYIHIHTCN